MSRKLLIIAPPRSGTTYCSLKMRHHGYDVGHEQMGVDGMSSWLAAIETEERPFGLRPVERHSDYNILHVVRDPLLVVTSLVKVLIPRLTRKRMDLLGFVGNHCHISSGNTVGQAVEFFNKWTALCEAAASRTVRIEEFDRFVCDHFPRKPSLAERPPKTANTRGQVPPLTRRDLAPKCTASAIKEFNLIRQAYGYA